ncbi:MAG: glycosyltransferase family 2 protein [Muribaculaceae bacterium]|nr:glycosyltransferase family 2 protein [Muribaculaceae bacterium]
MKSTIAIVIPVYNREKLVLRSLESIARQSVMPKQLIVVDNNSTDNSYQSVKDWISVHPLAGVEMKLIAQPTPGAANARNAGFEQVATDYVYFLDSDDCAKPELVEEITKAAENYGNPELILMDTAYADGRVKKYFHKDLLKAQLYQARICTLTFAAQTDFFRKVGQWNGNLRCWDDWELGVRLLAQNPKMVVVDKVLSVIYPQAESITGENHYSKAGEWERAIDAAEEAVKNRKEANALRRMINYRRLNLAALYKQEGRSDLAIPLRKKALEYPLVTKRERIVLNLIYQFTSRGFRGGYILYDYLVNLK